MSVCMCLRVCGCVYIYVYILGCKFLVKVYIINLFLLNFVSVIVLLKVSLTIVVYDMILTLR